VGRIYDAVRGDFEGEPRQEYQEMLVEGQSQLIVRCRFESLDQRQTLVVGPASASVHVLPPYRGWEEHFGPLCLRTYRNGSDSIGGVSFTGANVRYINYFHLPVENLNISEYLTIAPGLPQGVPNRTISNVLRNQLHDTENNAVITLNYATQASLTESKVGIILDIAVQKAFPDEVIGADSAFKHLELLHGLQRRIFELCITDKLRSEFDANH
jgi:uncharacterized protein (TIGR04255 family)